MSKLILYTDGSFMQKRNDRFGGGVLIINPETNQTEYEKAIEFIFTQPEMIVSRNISAEVFAGIYALDYLSKREDAKELELEVRVDYNGLQKWADGVWNNKGSYVSFLWKQMVPIYRSIFKKVEFVWIKGHSNDRFNNYVDRLATGVADAKTVLQFAIGYDNTNIYIIDWTGIDPNTDFETLEKQGKVNTIQWRLNG